MFPLVSALEGLPEGVIHLLLPCLRVVLCEIQSANIY